MNKRDDVIRGLECCSTGGLCEEKCPYDEEGMIWTECVQALASDALSLLKAQKPRVLTPEDFNNNSMVDRNGSLPCWVEYRKYNGIARRVDGWGTINRDWVNGYRDRRFWTTLPTDEQKEKVKWDEPRDNH